MSSKTQKKTKTKTKPKLLIVSSTSSSSRAKTLKKRKPKLIVVSTSSSEMRKKLIDKKEEQPPSKIDLKTPSERMTEMKTDERMNEKYIELMEKLSKIMLSRGEIFRARSYQKAQETIIGISENIINPDQLKEKPGIGKTILEKLDEYTKTGTLKILEREKENPVNLFVEIYGVGPKKAKELVEKGVTTISQLRERESESELLNDIQRVGLKYYEDILQRIPRAEIVEYEHVFTSAFPKTVPDARMEIVGSYRRGAQNSGDIDVIITSTNPEVFKQFVDKLIAEKIILEVLSRGPTKCLVITKLPGAEYARRVDFLYTGPEEYPFSVLYFTGSKAFNTVMRQRALNLGYTMNEHGIYKMEGKKKGAQVDHIFKSEKDIFDFLNMEYKEPPERIDGRAVAIKGAKEEGLFELKEIPVLIPEKEEVVIVPEEGMFELKEEALKTKSKSKPKKSKLVIDEAENVVLVASPKTKTVKKRTKQSETKKVHLEVVDIDDSSVMDLIHDFKENGISVLEPLSESQLSSMLNKANIAYRNLSPIMSDNEYDIIQDFVAAKFPSNETVAQIGAPVMASKNKATLPYQMASMDKIKPDSGALSNWMQKYKGPYVLSCKLDGVSGLYTTEGKTPKLYTRGDGKVGQDVSHLIPYLRLPKKNGLVIRGEFLLPKTTFDTKYKTQFANARNLVSGIVNRITVDEKANDLHFVSYEVIKPELKPSEQMAFLATLDVDVVMNRSAETLSNEMLSETLVDWRKNYVYEVDGVIVTDDKIYPRKSGNPEHSFAFKMVLSDQLAEAKVVDVIWRPSKDGYLKPRVQIEPIHLGGVKIEYATGFNGAFIEQNKIGIGAMIEIIRSGDVIPHIRSVTTPAEKAKMPSVPYKWNDTHVDIMLEDISQDATVREKNITGFFRGIGVDGLSGGNIARIIDAGFDTIPKIVHMTKTDFLTVEGFKEKLATKIFTGIREKLDAASLLTLMSASNIFGRGIGEKKIGPILEAFPDIIISSASAQEKITKVSTVAGMAKKSAELFVNNIPAFIEFMKECGLESKFQVAALAPPPVLDASHPLYKKSIVMTGFRDETISKALIDVGAKLGSSVSKNTFAVLVKDKEEDTGKANEARKLNVPLYTPEEFVAKYF